MIKVLLVDDEENFREALKRRLGKRNMEVHGMNRGETALEFLDHHSVDVVILDMRMPGMNGLETLRVIKERVPETEVILLTGQVDLESAMRGLDLGALDYCIKPMDIDDLQNKIVDAYERKRLRQEGAGGSR